MALIKCKECENNVSTKADACPKCGAKLKSSPGAISGCIVGLFKLIGGLVGGLVGLLLAISFLSDSNTRDPVKELEKACLEQSEKYSVVSERNSYYDNCVAGGKAAFDAKGVSY